jgi:putative CocE/NonD family hydrolase
VTDLYFEDFHHNGALTQGYFYAYPIFGIQTGGPTPDHWWAPHMVQEGLPDDYDFQLGLGPLATTTERYYRDNFFWQEIVQHPDYDAFWRARAVTPHLKEISAAVLVVGGWFDAENLYGPLAVYKTIERQNPGLSNTLVMGPFGHRQWVKTGAVHTLHGDIYFGDSLETRFQRDVEARFFRHYLKEDGNPDSGLPEAYLFDTGSKEWKSFAAWPSHEAVMRRLFFGADGSLAWTKPRTSAGTLAYVSDPAKPVPSRCLVPTIEDLTLYMSDDQRCFASRPDVLTFETPVLDSNVTLGGEITAHLEVATTGTDADFVVKLIDVYPEDAQKNAWSADAGPAPGEYAKSLNGYQLPIAMEIRRGRYNVSYEHPQPLVANQPTVFAIPLRSHDHVFLKGHRLMVQIQSTWFPLIDRNPQKFVPSIYEAKAEDFQKATQRVYTNSEHPSYITLPIVTIP